MPTFKINGAKFPDMDSLKTALWEIYKESMSKEEFEKYVTDNTQEISD